MKLTDVKIGGGGRLGKTNVHRARCGSTGIRSSRSGLCFGLCCVLILLLAASASAETIIYPEDGTPLRHIWTTNDLAPDGTYQQGGTSDRDGWSNSLNNNHITVNSGTINNIFGAYYEITTSGHPIPLEVIGNQVIVKSGVVGTNNVYGGYAVVAQAETAHVTANENTVIVNGGSGSGVWGGYAESKDGLGEAFAGNNIVTIDGSLFESGSVVGGAGYGAITGNATNNELTISNSTFDNMYVAGGDAYGYDPINGSALSAENSVTIRNSEFTGSVFGGDAAGHDAAMVKDNVVIIDNSTFDHASITGGYANSENNAEAIGNRVIITGGNYLDVSGGYAGSDGEAKATNNSVTINGGTFNWFIYGGMALVEHSSGSATAAGNSVTITDGTFEETVYGGVAGETGIVTALNNSVTIKGGMFREDVVGGDAYSSSGEATAADNSVTISGSTIEGRVRGGYASINAPYATGTFVAVAEGNEVTISDGVTFETVAGGSAEAVNYDGTAEAESTDNIVNISGGTNRDVYGGYAYADSTDGDAIASASDNIVNISGGTINRDVLGGFVGATSTDGDASATASGNIVNISGSTINRRVIGGDVAATWSHNKASATVSDNEVNISGSTINESVTGGSATANSRVPTAVATVVATASGNVVNISGSTINGSVLGGSAYANSTAATAVASAVATASGNVVNISGGTVNGDVYGGYADAYSTDGESIATATGNTVTISGDVTIGETSRLYGGLIFRGTTRDAFMNNTLNLSSTITVAELGNFEYYNFVLPANLQGLTVTEGANLGTVEQPSVVESVHIRGGGAAPAVGESIVLIDAGDGIDGKVANLSSGQKGAVLNYDYEISISPDTKQLLATVQSVELCPESKILSEGFLAGSILLNQTGDMIAQRTEQARCGAFFDITGGSSRYNTGSHVDMKGFSLLTGLTRCVNTASGKMTYGAFFEYGNGNDTGLYVTGARGNSDVYHYGGGVLGRLNLRNSVYAEGSFRAGGMDNGFTSNLLDGAGNAAGYDSSSAYIGTHLGLGRKLKLSSRNTWDVYGKYFWTHQNGGRVTLSTNDPVRFESIDSHRMRLGGRSTSAVNRRLSTYWGAAWEHEFAGTAKATTYGYAIDSPSLRGSTGIGELGVSLKSQRALALDLGVQGYIGKREGIAGSAQVRWMW